MPPLASEPDRDAAGAGATPTPNAYLCQVNHKVSCGACCGLYNVADLSRPALFDRLSRRTLRFAETPRTEEAIEGFRHATEGWTPEERPFPQFHHCPFLGLVGRAGTRVGCLLHPDVPGNQGRNWRHLSYYGATACAAYLCPASRSLPTCHLLILRDLFDDWYPYGLIITEHRLSRAVFETLEARITRPVGPADFPRRSSAAAALRELLELKLTWPYRNAETRGPCHFVFDNGLYPRPGVQWPSAARPGSPYETLFREMESRFRTEEEVRQACADVAARFQRLVGCLEGRAPG